jgi:hypothetical protein
MLDPRHVFKEVQEENNKKATILNLAVHLYSTCFQISVLEKNNSII